MKNCPVCAREIPDYAVKCMHCGGQLPEKGSATSPKIRVEPTEFQAKVFRTFFVVLIVILAAAIVLLVVGQIFGWLPDWNPIQK